MSHKFNVRAYKVKACFHDPFYAHANFQLVASKAVWKNLEEDDAPLRKAIRLAEGEKFRAIYDVAEPAADRGRRAVVL